MAPDHVNALPRDLIPVARNLCPVPSGSAAPEDFQTRVHAINQLASERYPVPFFSGVNKVAVVETR